MTATRLSSTRPRSRHEGLLGTGLVVAAVATAVGAFWVITGPAAAEPGSHQLGRHLVSRTADR